MKNILKKLVVRLRPLSILVFSTFITQASAFTISGRVLDVNRTPVYKPIVILDEHPSIDNTYSKAKLASFTCKSDATGAFAFTNLPLGTYILSVLPQTINKSSADGLQYIETIVELSLHSISDIVLKPVVVSRLDLYGQVLSIMNSSPIQGEIAFMPMPPARAAREVFINSELLTPVETDEHGTFIMPNISPGKFSITLKVPDKHLLGDFFPFDITITEEGEIIIAEDLKAFMAASDIRIAMWTKQHTPSHNIQQGISSAQENFQVPQELHIISGSGIITHLEMDPSNPGFGLAHIQMLDSVGQEKGIHQYEVAISPNTIASIFSNLYRQSDTDAPHLALSEWPVKIGKPYFFEISPRTNTYLLKSIGFVAKENVKQVRTAYLASGWFQINPEQSVILSEEIQELELELLKLGDHCAAQRIAETYPELVKPLRTRHRELYSIYAELHSHLKQIPPHATIVRSVKYPKDSELSISGIVLDVDGHPVQGKTVALLNNRIELDSIAIAYPLLSQSDQSGYFHFDNLEQGIYDLFVAQHPLDKGQTHIHTVYTTSVIHLSLDSISAAVIKPVPAPRFYVQAEVLSYDTGKPVPSEMELFPLPSSKTTSEIFLNPDLLKPIKSLKSGLLSIPNLSTGDYLCTIYGDSRQKSATFVLTITEDNSVEIETKWKVLLGRRGIPARFWTMKWPPLN